MFQRDSERLKLVDVDRFLRLAKIISTVQLSAFCIMLQDAAERTKCMTKHGVWTNLQSEFLYNWLSVILHLFVLELDSRRFISDIITRYNGTIKFGNK